MKKHISIVLLLVLILTNTIAFAAPGDIIHTGLKKVYKKTIDDNLLVEDVLDPKVEKDKFFREIEVDGNVKFVNIVEEENAHEKWIIENMPKDLDLTNEEAVKSYILSQASKLEEITREIAKGFDEIGAGMTWEEYQSYHNAPKLKTPDNYSIPEPGFKEGSTKIARLKLPTGASKWQIQISHNEVLAMKKDTLLKDGRDYVSNRDIDIDVGKYLVLYAVDKDNKIKAYENIKITENMINTPKEPAIKIEVGKISEGEKYAGAVKIDELNEKLPEGASRWQVFISPIPVEKVYKVKMTDATDYNAGDDVVVAKENELHPIADSFRRYLVLLAVDNEGIVQGYNTFEIGKDKVSKAPSLLIENTHYKGPVPGDSDGTTKFTELHIGLNPDENMKDAKSWKAWISENPIAIPKLNADETAGTVLSGSDEVDASIGNYLLLTAIDNDGKIKGYRIFHLTENMVKGKTAAGLEEDKNYSTPSKGTIQGTTKINYLNLTGIEGATKWMYKVSENLANPILNKVVEGSSDYTAGQNIRANVGDDFLLLATDNEGKVKAFAKISLTSSVIADPPAILLREGVNYVGPVKGDNPGTTKFESLSGSASIGENPGWMYVVSDEEPEIPELNSEPQGAEELKAKDSIGENLLPGKYLMLLATENGLVKGYTIFRLNDANIKMGPAIPLEKDKHYSPLEKGTGAGTTKIASLNPIGIEGVDQWRYKIDRKSFLEGETIELNTIIPQTTVYSAGNNIRAEVGDYLLLLATDRSGRVRGYREFKLEEEQITKPNATLLIPRTNYTEPEAGTNEGTTIFSFLDFSTNVKGANKWMYVIGDKSFGNIELDSVIGEALPAVESYKAGDKIDKVSVGDYLLLLATDKDGKIKGYREFRLTDRNIRGGPAKKLELHENYDLEKGNKPGTTKFTKLVPLGMEGSIRWKYKLMDNTLPNDEKPYLNSIIEDTNFVNVGQDIDVSKFSSGDVYGYMLLLAADGSNRTKGYAEIKIESAVVKEHAPILNVELKEGSVLDSVKITGTQPTDTSIKYVMGYREFSTPAVDEVLDVGISYELGEDILQVKIGDYIAVYEVDADNKIKAFNGFKITTDDIKKGSATIADITLLEGSINNGGSKIEIQLENGKWASDLKTNADKRQALYNGFKTNSEPQEWAKVVASLVKDGSGAVDIDNNKLIISLPETKDYDITKDQEITLIVPAIAIENATNPIDASGKITIKPTVKATISGDVVNSVVRENDIKAGGKTIVIELKDGDWIGDIDSKDNINALIEGFRVVGTDNQTDTNWHKIATKIKVNPTNIVRNSSKKLTITLPKVEGVSFGVNKEIISLTIPKSLIQGAQTEVVATPTFTLYPNVLQVAGEAVEDTVSLEAPDGRVLRANMDIWKIKVETGTLKDNITDKDIIVSGLPRGLRANVIGVDDDIITIKVSGTAAAKIEEMEVQVKVKGEAVEEPNSLDSEDIKLYLKISETIESKLKDVNYDLRDENGSLKIYLVNADNEMEYSINSTNGINGNWISASSGPDGISLGDAEPIKIWVREKAQPKVFRLVGELKYRPAPVYVKISQYNYSDTGLEIVLEGPTENENIEYSTNGGENWSPINAGEFIELDADSDLRIRYKAVPGVGGKLPSLSTEKLNGLYLGNVKLNVAEGVIENTTTNMEYSTDREKYTQARNGNTPVNFVKDTEIWIRERGKGNEINRRILGKVGQMEFNEIDLDKVDYDISEGKISLENSPELALGEYEYKIANDPWKDVDDGKNIEFKAGSLQFRKKGDTTNLPSEAREKAVIAPPAPAPELSYDDTNHTIEKIGTNEGIIYEYSIDSGSWNLGDKDPEFKAGQEVRIREKAKARQLASEIQTIRFTPNLDLSNVYLDAGKSMIINTTTEMEYSLNSTDGLDGQWYKASSPNTNIPLKKNMTVWIREAKKPKNNRELGDGPMIERILNKKIIEERIGYSIKDNTIWIKTGKDLQWLQDTIDNLQYRNGGNTWINVPYTKLEQDKINILAYNIGFKPGKLEFRLKGDQNNLPSKPVEKNTIKANASAPNVEVDYVEDKVISINSIDRNGNWDIFEYNIDNGPWISGRYLKTEDLSGEKILRIRTAATASELPSQEVVIHFKEKLPLEHVILSTHVKPLELNGTTTQMEYRVNDGPWQPCQDKNTKLKRMDGSDLNDINVVNIIEIRDSQQPENVWVVYEK